MMGRGRTILAALLALGLSTASAEFWLDPPGGYKRMGGGSRLGPYPTLEDAQRVNNEYFGGQALIFGEGPGTSGGSSSQGGGGTGDPMVDAMMPVLQQGFSQMGEALARSLFGDPQEKARQARQRELERLAEEERMRGPRQFARDMAERKALDDARYRDERHRKILKSLKRLSAGVLGDLPRGEDAEVDLAPAGNSFFGLGGGGRGSLESPHNDPMVVDLRHLKRASFLAQEAGKAPGTDSELLLDEAQFTARGGGGFLQVYDDEGPTVDEKGLIAFQKASADYARVHDLRGQVARVERDRLKTAELSAQSAREARAEFEAAQAAGVQGPELEAKRQKAEGLFAEAQREEESWLKAREHAINSQTAEALAWSRERRTLQAVASNRDPGVDPYEKAPPAGVDGKAWKGFQEEMIASRKAAEAERARLLRDLPPHPPPEMAETAQPVQKVHVHEGVILGTFGSEAKAEEMAREGRSPFTGQTYQEMNARAFWNQPGRQGAVVAGFGTPEDAAASTPKEIGRIVGDHFSRGQVALQTPQAQQALEKLDGKSYDRLVAHSNGSPIALALIERGSIEVNELHVVGGDRALTDARYLQSLVDRGKVKRVVVWTHTNDVIPLGTSAIPFRTDEPELLAEHVARKAAGTAQGTEGSVRFLFSKGQAEGLDIRNHYLQESYYPDIAKAYGTPWPDRR